MRRILAFLGVALALGLAQTLSPEALRGASPEEALLLAKRFREAGAQVISYVTPEAFFFEFPDGRKAQVALGDRFLVAVAPYRQRTRSTTSPAARRSFGRKPLRCGFWRKVRRC